MGILMEEDTGGRLVVGVCMGMVLAAAVPVVVVAYITPLILLISPIIRTIKVMDMDTPLMQTGMGTGTEIVHHA